MCECKQKIMDEIETIREKLNVKMLKNTSRMPDCETIELSHRLDDLLNMLQKEM